MNAEAYAAPSSAQPGAGDEVAGLDRVWTELVSIAIVHAAGFTESTSDVVHVDDKPTIISIPPLAQWPDVSR